MISLPFLSKKKSNTRKVQPMEKPEWVRNLYQEEQSIKFMGRTLADIAVNMEHPSFEKSFFQPSYTFKRNGVRYQLLWSTVYTCFQLKEIKEDGTKVLLAYSEKIDEPQRQSGIQFSSNLTKERAQRIVALLDSLPNEMSMLYQAYCEGIKALN